MPGARTVPLVTRPPFGPVVNAMDPGPGDIVHAVARGGRIRWSRRGTGRRRIRAGLAGPGLGL